MQDIIDKYISEGKTFREAISLAYDEKPAQRLQQGGTWEKQLEKVRQEKAQNHVRPTLTVADLIAEKKLRDQNIGRELPPQVQRDNTRVNISNSPELISKVARNKTDKEIAEERKYIREQDAKSPVNTDFFNPNSHTREN